jgi:hypothetical protein
VTIIDASAIECARPSQPISEDRIAAPLALKIVAGEQEELPVRRQSRRSG